MYNNILRRVRVTIVTVNNIKYYIFWVWVCSIIYPAYNAHAPYYILICGLSVCTIFFHIISYTARFSGNENLLNIKMCILILFTNLYETFLILRIIQRQMNVSLHVKSKLLSDLNGTWIFSTDFRKIITCQIKENPPSGSQVVPCGRTEKQTWCNSSKAPSDCVCVCVCFTQYTVFFMFELDAFPCHLCTSNAIIAFLSTQLINQHCNRRTELYLLCNIYIQYFISIPAHTKIIYLHSINWLVF